MIKKRVQLYFLKEEKKDQVQDPIAEQNEIDIANKIDKKMPGTGNRLEATIMNRIEYDMSENKKKATMLTSSKKDMELMRRWNVKIFNIYITPLEKMIDPFIQFTIGGNYKVQVYETKEGDKYKIPSGERGYADKTEVQENVDINEKRPYDKIVETEMRMSYSMVESQKLMVEVWDYNTVWMNTIVGYTTLPLLEIVTGDMNMCLEVERKEKKRTSIEVFHRSSTM
jgi:hypothetical protein